MKIRYHNAKVNELHLSTADLPSDLGEAKDELKSRLDAIDIDMNIIAKYQGQVDELKNLKKDLKNLVNRFNADSDKIAQGGMVISRRQGDDLDYVVMTEDELNSELDKVRQTNEDINRLNEERKEANKERQAEIDAEIANKQEERKKSYQLASDCVENVTKGSIEIAEGLLSGNNDRMVNSVLVALGAIFSFLGKTLAFGLVKSKALMDKLSSDNPEVKPEELEELKQIELDVVSESQNISTDTEPMTPEEREEINGEITEQAFDGVGKVTDWDSAFKYGYAKLKQIHGINYDEAKATKCLEGLKKKYPDTPQVVFGALKFGGHRKKTEEEKNSRVRDFRKLNSVAERYLQESFDKLIRDNGWNRGEYDTDEAFLVKDDSAYIFISKNSSQIYRLLYYVNQKEILDEKSRNIDDLIDIAKDIISGKKFNSRTSNAIPMNYVDEAKNLLYQINPDVTEPELQKLCDFGFGLAANPQDFIDVLKDKLAQKSNNSREKVDEETLAKAKESGVIQMKPNGSWGIISISKGEWWIPDYESEDAARNALKAYHAGRFMHSRFDFRKVNSRRIKLSDNFDDAQAAYEWLQDEEPGAFRYAYLERKGKTIGLSFGFDANSIGESVEKLFIHSNPIPGHFEIVDPDEWQSMMGEMFDYINKVCETKGEDI
jgi:hypothetical protein